MFLFCIMAACDETPLSPPEKLRVLELYSGIGGMHWALKGEHIHCFVLTELDLFVLEKC